MAYTYTHTKTSVYTIGDELAATKRELAQAALKMKEIESNYKDDLQTNGVAFKPTNELSQLSTMRMQWRDVMKLIIPQEELAEINEILSAEKEEPTQEFDKFR